MVVYVGLWLDQSTNPVVDLLQLKISAKLGEKFCMLEPYFQANHKTKGCMEDRTGRLEVKTTSLFYMHINSNYRTTKNLTNSPVKSL